MNQIKFTEGIYEATRFSLENLPNTFVIGLGVSYKNGADGTMGDLKDKFPTRVLDAPVSEAAITGLAIGSSLTGLRPIVHHGRVEFSLFAADQIFTQAAKWNYMFGGNSNLPIVFRIGIGRQWGNGPQHTQALYSLFGSVPGLKVVIPSSPKMARSLLLAAIEDDNPVVFLEPRWLYQTIENVESQIEKISLSKSRQVKTGEDVTIATYGDGVLEALVAAKELSKMGIECEIIDLVTINPIDLSLVKESLSKTQLLVTLDTTNSAFCIGTEIISKISIDSRVKLKKSPILIACPDFPCPTAPSLTQDYYPTWNKITNKILRLFDKKEIKYELSFEELNLAPKKSFD